MPSTNHQQGYGQGLRIGQSQSRIRVLNVLFPCIATHRSLTRNFESDERNYDNSTCVEFHMRVIGCTWQRGQSQSHRAIITYTTLELH